MLKISYYIAFSQVKSNSDDFGWGVVLNFQKKANQKVNKKTMQISQEKIVSGIGGHLWKVVAYKRWSHMESQLYHAISGQGIEQLGALFGSVFPLF